MQYETHLVGNSMNALYPALLQQVLINGEETAPRGQKTVEVRPFVFELTNPMNRMITLPERKLNTAFALVEALQLVAATENAPQQLRFNSKIVDWVDPTIHQTEIPYGVAIRDQIVPIIDELKRDPDSRRAVMTIYEGRYRKDLLNVPCTCSLQFFVREGHVELTVYMRANDLWWGTPYDVFQFTMLQELIAIGLEKPMGKYVHVAGSGHLYEPMYDKAQALVSQYMDSLITPMDLQEQGPWLGGMGDTASDVIFQARTILEFEQAAHHTNHRAGDLSLVGPPLTERSQIHLMKMLTYQDRKKTREQTS